MDPLLRIKDWLQRYEIAQSRIVKTLTWVAEPNGAEQSGLDLSRRKLLKKPGGLAAWAVYELLIKAASRLPPGNADQVVLPCRGYLAGADGPWSVSDLEIMLDVDADEITAALDLLTASAVSLIERVDPKTFKPLDGDSGSLWGKRDQGNSTTRTLEPDPRTLIASMSKLRANGSQTPETDPMSTLIAHYENAPATGQDRTRPNTTGQDRTEDEERADAHSDSDSSRDGPEDRLSNPRDRRQVCRMKWLLETERLWGVFQDGTAGRVRQPRDSKQWKADRTSAERMFDDIWPEDLATRPERLDWALKQINQASKNGRVPMAWLTEVIKERIEAAA